ncbi:MAG: dTMP kinase [Candidatus Omnitrophica bacterium]|nr:dTMP kinase [Candidatus Omnitrophota bacterium]
MKRKSLFITLEGLEGCGKSSVITHLAGYLRKKKLAVGVFREPGSTKTGEKIRQILLGKKNNVSPHTELLLYLAARTQLIEEQLQDAFMRYDIVLCDRFFDSTIAYQGYGLGLGKTVEAAVKKFSLGITPDLTVFLETDVKISLGRIKNKDRIESRSFEFHSRLKRGFKEIARKNPRRVRVIKADKSLEAVYRDLEEMIDQWLQKKGVTPKS